MSSDSADRYEEYNYEQDKYVSGHSGKGRTKKEETEHHHSDSGGHTRKIVTNMMNSHEKDKKEQLKHPKEQAKGAHK